MSAVPPASLILMYHRVARTDTDPWGMCVSPENFCAQLQAIKRVGEPLSLPDFVIRQRAGTLPARSVVVTFDDGYLDNFETALPLLKRHGVPATLFVTTCNIDSDREFWWDRLESLLLSPGTLPPRLPLDLPDGEAGWDLGDAATYSEQQLLADQGTPAWRATPGTRLRFFYDVWKTLWPLPEARRDQAVDAVAGWAGSERPQPGRRTLRSAELREMAACELMTIGAHTVNHPPLPAHPAEEQSRQILGSRDRLQEILGERVSTFAYPHGEYCAETIALLQSAGFDCAVTVVQKLAGPDTEPMLLPRFGVKDVGGEEFEAELRGRFDRHASEATRA